MSHTYTVWGDWMLKKKWYFKSDQSKGTKLLFLMDGMAYAGLLQIVIDEYELDSSSHVVQLSYALPETMLEKGANETTPVFLTSDRQVQNFVQICKSNSVRLCVSVTKKLQESGEVLALEKLFSTRGGDNKNLVVHDQHNRNDDDDNVNLISAKDVDFHVGVNLISAKDVDFHVGQSYSNKAELQRKLWMLSVKYKFGWRAPTSDTTKLVVVCKTNGCSWMLRATKKDKQSEYFWITKYISVHTCTAEDRRFAMGTITPKVVGKLILDLFGGISKGLRPGDLEKPLLKNYGLTLTYHQLWDALEEARKLLRGSPESGYEDLPKYFYKIKKENPGTVADLELDADHRFKYLFFSLGACLKGFEFIRKVIAVDGSFLKAKFKGTYLLATAQDGDNQIYPIAFGVVDSENDAAWEWFFSKLEKVIPDSPNLVFVSDRNQSIAKAIEKVYPSANRGICFFHLENNITNKFGKERCYHLVKRAASTYCKDEFDIVMEEIRRKNPTLREYLDEADIRLWSTAHFQGNRYNITTTNIAESINGLFKEAREYPIVAFLDHVRATLMRWFYERRETSAKLVTNLAPYAHGMVEGKRAEAETLTVCPINLDQFHVFGGSQDGVVDMKKLSCSCRMFDIDKIPCIHALAVAMKEKIPAHTLSDPCFTKDYMHAAYSESIYPVQGILNDSQIPLEVREQKCLPPKGRRNRGRPKKGRFLSPLEIAMKVKRPRRKNKCSRCLLTGHNKATCKTPLP